MQKALITYKKENYKEDLSMEVPFPIRFPSSLKEFVKNTSLYARELISIDVAPEEEYFLTSDEDGHDYIIPVALRLKWQKTMQLYDSEAHPSDVDYAVDQEFGQYRVEGDWEKTYKIVKR